MKRIVLLAFDGIVSLDLFGPLQVFATARSQAAARGLEPPYEVVVASLGGGPVQTAEGVPVLTSELECVQAGATDTVLVPGGSGSDGPLSPAPLVSWLRHEGRAFRRICSVCVGAFPLADAGLLDGRRVTTHWRSTALLQERCPSAQVESGPVFVRDGHLWTSAGVSAGIDLALHLVEDDLGRAAAMEVARTLVVFLRRPGGQAQFSAALQMQDTADHTFSALLEWVSADLARDLTVPVLAAKAGMAPRTFGRKFLEATGRTPAAAVAELRLEAARRLLEDGGLPLKQVALRCGYGDEQALRRAFRLTRGASPRSYRERFS